MLFLYYFPYVFVLFSFCFSLICSLLLSFFPLLFPYGFAYIVTLCLLFPKNMHSSFIIISLVFSYYFPLFFLLFPRYFRNFPYYVPYHCPMITPSIISLLFSLLCEQRAQGLGWQTHSSKPHVVHSLIVAVPGEGSKGHTVSVGKGTDGSRTPPIFSRLDSTSTGALRIWSTPW